MAQINDPNVTAQLATLANTGIIDTDQIVALLNTALPAGQQIAVGAGVTTGIYKRFGEFDKVNAKVEVVTTGLWTNDEGQINNFYTSSTQAAATSGKYYYNVYSYDPQISSSAEVEFAIAYGHVDSSGSATLDVDNTSTLATKATYAQYKSILLEPTDAKFSFPNSTGTEDDSNSIYVINIARNRFRESMDAGNWELNLSGSLGNFTFIDDSGKKFGDNFGKSGRVFNIVEGVLNVGTQLEATIANQFVSGTGFGLFYPDRGIMVFNPTALQAKLGDIHTENGVLIGGMSGSHVTSSEQRNHQRLYYSMKKGADFDARRTENVSTQHFFVRATNREFNYSNNPTYVDTNGFFTENTFETDPQTYITTIGLFNDSNEMIAVAKTSQPIVKSFDKEVLIKVKLSF